MRSALDFLKEGNRFYALGEFKSALDHYRQTVELNPRLLAAYNNQGNAQQQLNQHEAAIISYGFGIELDAKDPEVRLNRANTLLRLSRFGEALEDLRVVAMLYQDIHGAQSGQVEAIQEKTAKIQQICFAEGNRHYAAGDMKKAISYYQQADNKSAVVFNNKGNAHLNLQQWDLARDSYTQALQLNPQDPEIYCNRAGVWAVLGDWLKAFKDWGSAADLYTQQFGVQYPQKKSLTAKMDVARAKAELVEWKSERCKVAPEQIMKQLQSLTNEQLSAFHKVLQLPLSKIDFSALERLLTITGGSEKEAFYTRVHEWKEQKHPQPDDVIALYGLVNSLLQQLAAMQIQVNDLADEMDHTPEAKEQLRQINEHTNKNLRSYYHMLRSRLIFGVSGAFAIASLQIKVVDSKKSLLIDGLSAVGGYIPVVGSYVKFLADLAAFPVKVFDSIDDHRQQSRIARLMSSPQTAQLLIDRLSRLTTLRQQENILNPSKPSAAGLIKKAKNLYYAARNTFSDQHKKIMNAYDSLTPAEKLANCHATAILDFIKEDHLNHLLIGVDLDEGTRRQQIIDSLLKCLDDLQERPDEIKTSVVRASPATYVTKAEFDALKKEVTQLSDQKEDKGAGCTGDEQLQIFASAVTYPDSQNPQRLLHTFDRRRSLQITDISKELTNHGGKIDEMDSQMRQLQDDLQRLKRERSSCYIL